MNRILYIASTLQRLGPVNQLFYIVSQLDRTKYEPYILTLSPEPERSRFNDFLDLGISVESLALSRLQSFVFGKKYLHEKVEKISPDIIHSQGVRPDYFSSRLSSDAFRLSSVRNFPQIDYKMAYGRLRGHFLLGLQLQAFQAMDICCGVSEAVSTNLRVQFGLNNVETVRNGVDTDRYRPFSGTERDRIRERLGISKDAILYVTTIGKDERKDAVSVAKAFSGLDPLEGKILIFLGEGSQSEACKKIAADLPHIRFEGRVDNVLDYLWASDCFISASKAEGMPNAVLEALSAGLPVILSDIAPHKEIEKSAPEVTALFRLGDSVQLLAILQEGRREKLVALRALARSAAEKHFSHRNMAGQYQSVYRQLLSKKQRMGLSNTR